MPSMLLSLIFLISPLLTTSTPFPPPSNLIQSTCRATTNYSLCITTLNSSPNALNANTTEDLTKAAIAISLSYATNTCSYILSISKSAPTARSSALRVCAQRFGNAWEALQRAVRALEEEEYDYAAVHVGAAKEYPGMCRALFRGGTSPGEVSRMGMELEGLCQLDLDLVSLLNLIE